MVSGLLVTLRGLYSLLIVLDNRFIAHFGIIGVRAGVSLAPALAQQVPALIQMHLHRF